MSKELDTAMAEFLANGGVIQQGAYRESGRVEGAERANPWGAKKAGRPPATAKVETDEDEE
jgi:hypothetical protein